MPQDNLGSVVRSLVHEKIGCVVVVDPKDGRAVVRRRSYISQVDPGALKTPSGSYLSSSTVWNFGAFKPLVSNIKLHDLCTAGIVTKQDANRFFLDQVPLQTPVKDVMSTNLHPADPGERCPQPTSLFSLSSRQSPLVSRFIL